MASLDKYTHCTCGGNPFLSLLWWLHKVCRGICSPFLNCSMLTECTFPFFDLSIFFPNFFLIYFAFLPSKKAGQGGDRATVGPSGHRACWESEHLALHSHWDYAVKGNRLNHAVKQVFTGLHYNVIFSPPLSFSILLLSVPSESLDFFRLMIFDRQERYAWWSSTYCTSGNSVSGGKCLENTKEMWRPIKTHLLFYQTREINEKG